MNKTIRLGFLLLFCGSISFAQQSSSQQDVSYPTPQGYVNDFAGVIPSEYAEQINNLITEVNQKTTAEISIVTIKTVTPHIPPPFQKSSPDIETYAVELFEKWGIGKKGKITEF